MSNKPTIPKVNNATLTIQKNGTTVDTFTANSSSDKTVNISVPTNTNELTNGAGFIASEIDSMGEGWIRFKCGLQICYGRVRNNNNVESGRSRFSFPMPFSVSPNVVATPDIVALYSVIAQAESGSTWILGVISFNFSPVGFTPDGVPADYVAIGKWN